MTIKDPDTLIASLSLGVLLFALFYFGILASYLKNKLLTLYSKYISFCTLYVLIKIILFNLHVDDVVWQTVTDVFLWLGYVYYVKFLANAIDFDDESSRLQRITTYISYSLIIFYSISTFIQIFLPRYKIAAYIIIGLMATTILITTIYILIFYYKKSFLLYYRFLILGCFSLMLISLLGFVVEMTDTSLFHMNKFSFNCLAIVVDLIFFSQAVNLNIKKGWNEYHKYKEIIIKLEIEKQLKKENATGKNEISQSERVTEETEKIILDKLNKFELSKKFLKQNITLASLAELFNTNTTYLSHIVNKHKNKNFNAFLTELRLKYIIDKLQNEPEYRSYKITYIAEISGFSSYTTFVTAFKNFTGLPPSKFIEFSSKS